MRALLGNLGPVAALGMTRVLEDGGLEVVGGDDLPDNLVEKARRLQPDAVVLGYEVGGESDLGERIRDAAPEAKLILWRRDEGEMHVFDPGSSAPRRLPASASEVLLEELRAGRSTETRRE